MGRKPSAQVKVRQSDVRQMLVQGKDTQFIKAFIMNEYGISESTIENDLLVVGRSIRLYFEKNKDEIICEHLAKYDSVYEKAYEMMNYRDALRALRQKEEILRMHRAEPIIAIQNNTMSFDNVDDDQLKKAIEDLKKLNNGTE